MCESVCVFTYQNTQCGCLLCVSRVPVAAIQIVKEGARVQVSVPELGITVETDGIRSVIKVSWNMSLDFYT
jgi:uncharacterized Fe-S center protein